MTLYYAKPYIIKVKKTGKIKSYNKAFDQLLGESDEFGMLGDFNIKERSPEIAVEEMLHRQKAFTMILETKFSIFVSLLHALQADTS